MKEVIEGTNQWPVFHIAYMEENCSAVFIHQNCSCLCIKSAVLLSHCHFFNLPPFVHFNKNALFFSVQHLIGWSRKNILLLLGAERFCISCAF